MPCVSYALVKYNHGTVNMRLLRCMQFRGSGHDQKQCKYELQWCEISDLQFHTILTTVDEHMHVVNMRKAVWNLTSGSQTKTNLLNGCHWDSWHSIFVSLDHVSNHNWGFPHVHGYCLECW